MCIKSASSGGQYPPIHYQEQPLDGNLNLFPWNSSIERPQEGRSTKSGLRSAMWTVLETASLPDMCAKRHGV